MSDLEEQNDEICVLESIYTSEELQIERDDLISGKFLAYISPPPDFSITYKMMELADRPSDEIPTNVIHVAHLPPITLSFKLPPNYPSEAMPDYEISCSWLQYSKMRLLTKKLDELWSESKGMVILYIWTQFLKEDALSFLNIGKTLDLTGNYIVELKRLGRAPQRISKDSPLKEPSTLRSIKKRSSVSLKDLEKCGKKTKISRGPNLNMHLHQFLRAYAEDRAKTEFLRGLYMCDICFSEKVGNKCIQFKPCDHVYCRDCMKSYFEVRIKDGSIHSMPCPYDKCTSEALQSQIREAVGPNLYARYDKQLLAATLDKMQDITYCPRTVCGCPVMRENDEKMAVCPSCKHVFCVFCKMTYHGVEPCRLKNEEKMKLIQEYENGDASTKLNLEKRYGKKQILLLLDDVKSESWISSNSKPCPNCNVAIEKSDGCNKMSCWKCNAFFCWLCLSILDPSGPYYHYIDPLSRCNSQLFEGTFVNQEDAEVIFLDDDDDDDDDDEDIEDEDDLFSEEDEEEPFYGFI